MSDFSKKFISENTLETIRKRKEADGTLQESEEAYDPRSLYDRLQSEKMKKEEDLKESQALKNQVHRLDEEEVRFLDHVIQRDETIKRHAEKEAEELINQCKASAALQQVSVPRSTELDPVKLPPSSASTLQKSSQKSLLHGVVKRKSSDDSGSAPEKVSKCNDNNIPSKVSINSCQEIIDTLPTARTVLGYLPGIGDYSDSSSDESTDSSDIENAVMTLHTVTDSDGKRQQ